MFVSPDMKIFVLVPLSVQFQTPVYPLGCEATLAPASKKNTSGYLAAQAVHAGRLVDRQLARIGYGTEPITTIVLTVRNSKELRKVELDVMDELDDDISGEFRPNDVAFARFEDTNEAVYGRDVWGELIKVHTATAFGPVTSERMDAMIGHLELLP